MAVVDENVQDRQTYGEPSGWSNARRPLEDGAAQQAGVQDASPPSEPQEIVEEQTPTPASEPTPPSPSQPGTEELPFGKHPRWIERQQELVRERQRAEALAAQNKLLTETLQRVAPQPQAAPVNDPWDGLVNHPNPADAQYWQRMKGLMQVERQAAKQDAINELAPQLQWGMRQLAAVQETEFYRQNPEVKPGSEEAGKIAAYMNGEIDGVRHPLESAKRNVMYDKLDAENRALKQKQAGVAQKRQAALPEASAGIPNGSGLPAPAGNWRDRVSKALDNGGGWNDALKAAFS